ncbi:MAG: B12-binding domain-containing radical SAM protein [Deltaproteobacteria bacterium]|nr:B12-binding domain-containing radical SAM protein [Deltaproteobacteria bacterium]
MKLLLVASNSRAQAEPSLGIGYLAGYLKKYWRCSDLDIKILNYIPREFSKIIQFSPDVIGISALTNQYNKAIRFAVEMKEKTNAHVIIGGHHISIAPETFHSAFDAAVLGEGEQTFLEFLEFYKERGFDTAGMKHIKGLLYIDDGKVVATGKRGLIENLDCVPYPSRELFNMEFMLREEKNVFGLSFGRGTYMMTSRGCPFRCFFCSASAFWEKIRYHSPEYVVGEIRELIEKYQVTLIHIFDDLFSADHDRLRKIVQLIEEQGINNIVEFGMFCRANLFNEETCRLLKRMNTVFIEFGIESGSQRILNFLKRGTLHLEKVEEAVRLSRKYGIQTSGSFILGTPGETEEEMFQSLELIKRLGLDKFAFFILNPYPGTPLWDYAISKGLISGKMNWDAYVPKKKDNLTPEDIYDFSGQVFINKNVSPKRFVEIYDLFEEERLKLYDHNWETVFPEEEPNLSL